MHPGYFGLGALYSQDFYEISIFVLEELAAVSADQGDFLAQFDPSKRVAELAADYGCPGELITMWACLGVIV